jgi:hypothetical protein
MDWLNIMYSDVTAAETDTFHLMIWVAPYLWKIEECCVRIRQSNYTTQFAI